MVIGFRVLQGILDWEAGCTKLISGAEAKPWASLNTAYIARYLVNGGLQHQFRGRQTNAERLEQLSRPGRMGNCEAISGCWMLFPVNPCQTRLFPISSIFYLFCIFSYVSLVSSSSSSQSSYYVSLPFIFRTIYFCWFGSV
jgi:hypothetical protein